MQSDMVAQVVVDVPTRAIDKTFDYLVPECWVESVQPGSRVYVPFGRQQVQGYVLKLTTVDDTSFTGRLKRITGAPDPLPLVTPDLLALAEWLTTRCVCTLREAIGAILPGAFALEKSTQYRAIGDVAPDDDHEARLWRGLQRRSATYAQILARFGEEAALWIERMLAGGCIELFVAHRDAVTAKTEPWMVRRVSRDEVQAVMDAKGKRAPKQRMLLQHLLDRVEISLSTVDMRPSDSAVLALQQSGVIAVEEREVARRAVEVPEVAASLESPNPLNPWQEVAHRRIRLAMSAKEFREILLHGVTGSGKTEVYLHAISDTLQAGGGAIVLVPEISLTPQMVQRFVGRFGDSVAVLHSGLSAGERRDEWLRIVRGEAKIVVGARSAVFAPVHDLRLVIVDEEHEPSYKQEETPRYDAREVARWRAGNVNAVVLFGSATPSLWAMLQVERGHTEIAVLPQRANGRPLPAVTLVDMRQELKGGNRTMFSNALRAGLEKAVQAGKQAVLFLNRRGYASFMLCRNCGESLLCGRCDISLTLHRGQSGEWLSCHYCGSTHPVPDECPVCGEPAMRPYGMGTQQIEQAVHAEWPGWRVLRMDVDTTRRKGAHQDLFRQFLHGDADVLIGTQMIAKGLDFPNVTFVGVVAADTMLAVPDYRSAERTFQLLTQVAGRAGRADFDGETVIQTYQPEQYAIAAAATHDFTSFYRKERELREAFQYPPFCELTTFLAVHEQEELAAGAARRFEREIRRRIPSHLANVLPAVQAGVSKVEDRFRHQVVVKYSRWEDVRAEIAAAFQLVEDKMRRLHGTCVLDVNAARIW